MFRKSFTTTPFMLALICLCVYSCGNSGSSSNDSADFEAAEQQIIQDIETVIGDLPPPSIIPETLEEIGAEFNPDLMNDFEGLEGYLVNEDKAAMNLGIYATDIGYLISYGQMEESIEHMQACQQLSETLGVNTAFDMALMNKYQAAVGDKERMREMLNETLVVAAKRLESSERITMAALVLTGSFIEGLYIAIEVLLTYPEDQINAETRDKILEPLVKLILEQEPALIDIIQMMEDIPQDKTIIRMTNELAVLKLLYDSDIAEIREKMQGQSVDFVITDDMLLDINKEVIRIREEIVQ
jgi:hypothetical protein